MGNKQPKAQCYVQGNDTESVKENIATTSINEIQKIKDYREQV